MYVHMYMYIYMYMCLYLYMYMYVCTCMYVYMFMYMYMYVYVCVCACVFVHGRFGVAMSVARLEVLHKATVSMCLRAGLEHLVCLVRQREDEHACNEGDDLEHSPWTLPLPFLYYPTLGSPLAKLISIARRVKAKEV